LSRDSLDFSFSGLKTAVALYFRTWRDHEANEATISVADIAASFQSAVVDVLVNKTVAAADRMGVKSVVLAGGVARNAYLRNKMKGIMAEKGIDLFASSPEFCTDNGAMIGVAGFHKRQRGESESLTLDARSRFPLG